MKKAEITILDYQPQHQPFFEKFNRDWIEKYFWLEPIDKFVLTEPEKAILTRGGSILMGAINDEIAGTVALKKIDSSTYEFTKMAVDEKYHRMGLGEALSMAAIEKAKQLGASRILLYSQTSLEPAIHLYRKLGFIEVSLDPGIYDRCDIKMELKLDNITVITAGTGHATDIASIAKKSFRYAFAPFFDKQEELEQYLDRTYETQKIATSIAKPNNVFFIALSNCKPVGFAKVKKNSLNKQIRSERQMELQKIYVMDDYHGSKAGISLLRSVLHLANEIQPDFIWLDVLINNKRAIRFYEKNGFEKCGKHSFTIGTQVFNYDVMILPIAAASINKSLTQTKSYGNH